MKIMAFTSTYKKPALRRLSYEAIGLVPRILKENKPPCRLLTSASNSALSSLIARRVLLSAGLWVAQGCHYARLPASCTT